jgi:CheY-like chemotaxis protein
MARILLVEDDVSTVKVLTRVLQRGWPLPAEELQLDAAGTVAEAKAWLAQFAYDVVILDFQLPALHPGDHGEVDETLCLEVRRRLPAALVGHITSHPNDKQVKAHLEALHLERTGLNAFSLSKSDNEYPQKLLANVKRHLFAKPIERQLEKLFGEAGAEEQESSFDLTFEMAKLRTEITFHWQDLEEPLKARIRAAFKYVVTDDAGRLVNLKLF